MKKLVVEIETEDEKLEVLGAIRELDCVFSADLATSEDVTGPETRLGSAVELVQYVKGLSNRSLNTLQGLYGLPEKSSLLEEWRRFVNVHVDDLLSDDYVNLVNQAARARALIDLIYDLGATVHEAGETLTDTSERLHDVLLKMKEGTKKK